MYKNKVSIIIPLYNVEEYADDCIESALRQTYNNVEIILINDGSTDSCGEICDKYAKRDERVIVVHKKNGGLSDARNKGMDIMTGDYIFFLDGDDVIADDAIERLIKVAVENNADVVVGKYITFSDQCNVNTRKIETVYEKISKMEVMRRLYDSSESSTCVCGKLWVRKIFHGIRFPIVDISEDEYTTYKLYDRANKIMWVYNIVYYYRERKESLTRNYRRYIALDGWRAIAKRQSYLREQFSNTELPKMNMNHLINGLIYNYENILATREFSRRQKKEAYHDMIEILHSTGTSEIKEADLKPKVKVFLFKYLPNIYFFKAKMMGK